MPSYFSNNRTGGILGTDLNQYRGNINFTTMYNAGVRFTYPRLINSTNPLSWDPKGIEYVNGARSAGIKVGSFHLIRPDIQGLDSAVTEANRFANALYQVFGGNPGAPYGDIIPMVDVELPYPKPANWTADNYIDYVDTYINRLLEITGFNTVLFYSAKYIADEYNGLIHSTKGPIFSKYPLCLACKDPALYTGVNTTASGAYPSYGFETFGGWTEWLMWQFALDNPDVRQGPIYGTTAVDVDVDVLKPGKTLADLMNSTYAVAITPTVPVAPNYVAQSVKGRGTSKFNDLAVGGDSSIGGDLAVTGNLNFTGNLAISTDKNYTVSPFYSIHRELVLADLIAKINIIPAIPGKQLIVEKIQIYVDSAVNPTATTQYKFSTTEATPRDLIITEATRLGAGAKINTDGFSYFTETAGVMRKALPAGVGMDMSPVVVPTAGAMTLSVYYRYV